jgi:exodeoxyribonuclease V alpha subunit
MVDCRLMASLVRAMRLSCRLILVGDPDQLPSVGAGNILGDLIASDVIPTVHLSEIFRQARQSHIVVSSHQIVHGEMPDLSKRDSDLFFLRGESYDSVTATVLDLCSKRLPKAYGYSPLWDIQVISPTRKGARGTMELNRRLQERLNPAGEGKTDHRFGSVTFREQDKVMQVKNNYDINYQRDDGASGAGVFNGDIGVIEMIDRPSQTVLIRYDDRVATYSFDMIDEIEHAYAVTVHKSQGSEFEAVVMPLGSYHAILHYRNLLYTAVTRAKRLLIMLGNPETIRLMIENDRKTLRYTNLAALLRQSVFTGAGGGPWSGGGL